jgi:hypothetical protein
MIKILNRTMIAILMAFLGGCASFEMDRDENIGDDQVIIWRQDSLSAEELTPTKKTLPNTINYTFFLIPKLNWLQGQSQHAMNALYGIYMDYASRVGEQNLAVWLWENKRKMEPDTTRSMDFVYKLTSRFPHIKLNGGPYIVHLRLKQQYSLTVNQTNRRGLQQGAISERDLESLITEAVNKSGNEVMVLDMQECGMEGTENVLNWVSMSLRNRDPIISPGMEDARFKCKVRVFFDDAVDMYDHIVDKGFNKRIYPPLKKIVDLIGDLLSAGLRV